MRGFFREVMSIGIWVAAILITLALTSRFARFLPIDSVQDPSARALISAVVLFLGTLLLGNLVVWMFRRIMAKSTIGNADRVLGIGFGITRGALIVSLLVLAANMVPDLKREAWWQNSHLIPRFQKVAKFIHKRMPEGMQKHFDITTTRY